MAFFSTLLIFLSRGLVVIALLSVGTAAQCSNTAGNFTPNSTYGYNRNLMLSSLASNASASGGYFNGSIGQGSDKVYALAMCRGDLSSEQCFSCIDIPSQAIMKNCPNQKEAVDYPTGDPRCIARCSNRSFFGILETGPGVGRYDVIITQDITTNVDEFDQALDNLIDRLEGRVAEGSSILKFATDEENFTSYQHIYGLMQCTPDLSSTQCRSCLAEAVDASRGSCCNRKRGVTILRPNCIFQYNLDPFFESTPAPPPPPPPPPPTPAPFPAQPSTNTTTQGRSTSQTVIIVVPIIISLVLVFSLAYAFLRLRKPKKDLDGRRETNFRFCLKPSWSIYCKKFIAMCSSRSRGENASKSEGSLRFEFGTIRAATNDFSDANKLGQGGFGSVYKGRLFDGQEIAVKRLARGSAQGETEFRNEIVSMARLQHKNLVRLLGFCLEGKERLIIYEFAPNASLDRFIFDPIKRLLLNWEKRYKIIVGIAHGILYLHEDSQQTIIHRDLKAGNILLDREMNAKIADFGLARLFVVDQSQVNTRRIVGTYGYMAPEYAKFGRFSKKTDVFSFGVLVLEIVSGQRNSSPRGAGEVDHLLSNAWKIWKKGKPLKLIDPTLSSDLSSEKVRCIHIGLLCVQADPAKRPTMASVVLMLSSFSMSLQLPSKPGFLMHGNGTLEPHMPLVERFPSGVAGSDQSAGVSINEVTSSELYPR